MKPNLHSKYKLYYGDCQEVLPKLPDVACIFADPPDNLDLPYDGFKDKKPDDLYLQWLEDCLWLFVKKAPVVWLSYNAKWTFDVSAMVKRILHSNHALRAKLCIQTFTFGQHNKHDLGNNYRPLLRIVSNHAPLYPDAIRIQSERQKEGDKRANPDGKVPGDVFYTHIDESDVLDIPRVTGNSKQRRKWCPTQLNEKLVERCIKLTTMPGQRVLDPFAGTGTTLRVCKKIDRPCSLIEYSKPYCAKILEEHPDLGEVRTV